MMGFRLCVWADEGQGLGFRVDAKKGCLGGRGFRFCWGREGGGVLSWLRDSTGMGVLGERVFCWCSYHIPYTKSCIVTVWIPCFQNLTPGPDTVECSSFSNDSPRVIGMCVCVCARKIPTFRDVRV